MGQIRLEAVIGEDDHVGRLAVSGDETAQGTIDEGEVAVHHRTELGAVLRRRSHLAVVLGESILPERVADLVEAGQVDRQYGQVRADVNQPRSEERRVGKECRSGSARWNTKQE